jgi:hypothetical protein
MSEVTDDRQRTPIGELGTFLWQHRTWWMIPVLIFAGGIGLLALFGRSSAVAPFMYTF